MRIGINASFLRKPYTGIGQVTLHFLEQLARDGWDRNTEYLLYLEELPPADIEIPQGFMTRVALPLWRRDDLLRKLRWERHLLPRLVREDGCDAFLSPYQSATVLKGTPHLMVVHDLIPRLFPEYRDNLRKRIYWNRVERAIRAADHVAAVSRQTEKDLIRLLKLDARAVTVHYPAADPLFGQPLAEERAQAVYKKHGLAPGYLYHGGGLEKRKNTENLLLAYARLKKQWLAEHRLPPLPPLVISGALIPQLAPLWTDVEYLIRTLNLANEVRALGFVEQSDLPALYRGARAFLFPSVYEGFGLPVLEAMTLGTPVVTGKHSSLPEVGGDAVLYCRPEDPEDIALAVKNVLTRPDVRERLHERGPGRAARFTWETFNRGLLSDLRRLIRAREQ